MSEDELIPFDLGVTEPPGGFKNRIPRTPPDDAARAAAREVWAGIRQAVDAAEAKREAFGEANPHRVGACPECGAYRTDGRPPYIHKDGCLHEGDLQMDRWLAEHRAGDHGGPVLYCAEHDHAVKGSQP